MSSIIIWRFEDCTHRFTCRVTSRFFPWFTELWRASLRLLSRRRQSQGYVFTSVCLCVCLFYAPYPKHQCR